jgi:hypothetical protein
VALLSKTALSVSSKTFISISYHISKQILSNEEGVHRARDEAKRSAQKNLMMRVLGGNEPANAFIDDTAKQTGKGVGADALPWASSRRASFKSVAIQ